MVPVMVTGSSCSVYQATTVPSVVDTPSVIWSGVTRGFWHFFTTERLDAPADQPAFHLVPEPAVTPESAATVVR